MPPRPARMATATMATMASAATPIAAYQRRRPCGAGAAGAAGATGAASLGMDTVSSSVVSSVIGSPLSAPGAAGRRDPPELAAVHRTLRLAGHTAHTRDHLQQLADRTHLLELLHLVEEVVQREGVLAQLLGEIRLLLGVEVLLGTLDEREHVAHAQDPPGQAVRVEALERVGLLAGAEELHGTGEKTDA